MKQEVRDFLTAFALKNEYGNTDGDLLEILMESDYVYSEIISVHRWYEDEWRVVKIDDRLIGFNTFHTTGDNNWSDMDLEHDMNSVTFVETKEVVTTKYVAV